MTFNDTTTSRRQFLAGALGTALGAGALGMMNPVTALAAEESAKGAAKLRLGLATYQWGMDWDIPTMIANLEKAKVYGVELRTQSKYAHGVELELSGEQRDEVKKRFADSQVAIVAVACSERMDWPEAEKLKASIEASKKYLQLSHDIGSKSLRVFPNQFHPNVAHEKTIEQIAKAVDELGAFAAGMGQRVDLESHGPAGELATMAAIMKLVTHPAVGVRLNCDARDTKGEGLTANFNPVKDRLAKTVHLHNMKNATFPYQEQVNLLVKAGWDGWALMENSEKEPDRVKAIIEQREIWEGLVKKAQQA
nr:Putative uncharacterized protein AP endonuclease family 2 [uncultured bacterium]